MQPTVFQRPGNPKQWKELRQLCRNVLEEKANEQWCLIQPKWKRSKRMPQKSKTGQGDVSVMRRTWY